MNINTLSDGTSDGTLLLSFLYREMGPGRFFGVKVNPSS